MIGLHRLTRRHGDTTPRTVRPGSRAASRARAAVTVAATAALVLAAAIPILSTPPATATTAAARPGGVSQRLALPHPTGPYAVGRETLHLVDRARPDPWVPGARARELMVSMYYPARARPGRTAPYLTTAEARLLLEDRGLGGIVPADVVSGTRTSARAKARPVNGRHPLVVLSPGFTLHRHTLTNLAEELASHGYVVAAVDHAHESAGTAFPGGRVLTCAACEAVKGKGPDGFRRVTKGRARDVAFLLDRLTGNGRPTGNRRAWRHAGLIDPTRIGMAGHSIGGDAAAATMAADPRVLAGINLDGTFFALVPAGGLDGRPFLMLGTERGHSPGGGDETWDHTWPRLDGWKRWLTVTGTAHLDFSDVAVLADQLGLPDPESPLPGQRTAEIMRDYVTAFFDLHLRGIPQPLLDGPTAQNPEVRFHTPHD